MVELLESRLTPSTTHFGLTLNPLIPTTNTPFDVTVTAESASGTVDTAYAGTIHFLSTDPHASLPGDYVFQTSDQGTHVFSATFTTPAGPSLGSQEIAVVENMGRFNPTPVDTLFTGTDPARVAAADINGDGISDLAVTNAGIAPGNSNATLGSVVTLLGNGDGTFQGAQGIGNAPSDPLGLAEGNIQNNSNADFAVTAGFSGVQALLGDGHGNFTTPGIQGAIGYPGDVALGDINGDGNLDLVTAGYINHTSSADVVVLLGDGQGDFVHPPSPMPAFYPLSGVSFNGPPGITLGDFNGDGKLDIAVPGVDSTTNSPLVTVLLGNGNGTFGPATNYTVNAGTPATIQTFYDSETHTQDLAVVGYMSSTVSILLGNGNGAFHQGATYSLGSNLHSSSGQPLQGGFTIADVTYNGVPSIIFPNNDISGSGQVSVLIGNGNGTFQNPVNFPVGSLPTDAVVGDFTSAIFPGLEDIAVTTDGSGQYNAGNVSIYKPIYGVSSNPVTQLLVSGPSQITAGSQFSFTVTAEDQFSLPVRAYTGTVDFTSSDSAAVLPANTTLTNGVGTFTATLNTGNSSGIIQTITATDSATSSLIGTASVVVGPRPSQLIYYNAPASTTAGAVLQPDVMALESSGQIDNYFNDTVHFASIDGQAVLPLDGPDTTGNQIFFPLELKTAGIQDVTITDLANTSLTTTAIISVSPASATTFSVDLPGAATAGQAFAVTVIAEDAFGNIVPGYSGTVHFTSSDTSASLPGNSTLTGGIGTFSATFNTSGTQTLTATDVSNNTVTGTGPPVSVVLISGYVITAPSAVTGSGGSYNFNLTIGYYVNGVLDTTYTGDLEMNPNGGVGVGTLTWTGAAESVDFNDQEGSPIYIAFTNGEVYLTVNLYSSGGLFTLTATDTTTATITATCNITLQ